AGNRLQVLVAAIPLHLGGVRVDREDLVAALAQPLVHGVAPVGLGGAGHPRDRNPLVGQERVSGLHDGLHGSSLLSRRAHAAVLRRRIAPAIRSAPPAAKTAPATSRPRAIHGRAGTRAPRSARTSIPGRPSAFITTTVHDPLTGS